MTCITIIECSSAAAAQEVVSDVEAGELWGVNMGTTSKVSSYSKWALVEATKTRNYALLDSVPEGERFQIRLSVTEVSSFTESGLESKIWFLRGKIVGEE